MVLNLGVMLHIVILTLFSNYKKKIIIIITFSDHNAHTGLIFNRLNILPLYKLIQNRIGIMMYKNANDMLPPVMNELFTVNSNIHEHNTRQRLMLHTDRGHILIFSIDPLIMLVHVYGMLYKIKLM